MPVPRKPGEPRYVVRSFKIGKHTYWGVYDLDRYSYPSILDGKRIPNMTTDKLAVEASAATLNDNARREARQ